MNVACKCSLSVALSFVASLSFTDRVELLGSSYLQRARATLDCRVLTGAFLIVGNRRRVWHRLVRSSLVPKYCDQSRLVPKGTGAKVHWFKVDWWQSAFVLKCTSAKVDWCKNGLVPKCTGAKMSWCQSALVLKCPGAKCSSVSITLLKFTCPNASAPSDLIGFETRAVPRTGLGGRLDSSSPPSRRISRRPEKKCGLAAGKNAASRQPGRKKYPA